MNTRSTIVFVLLAAFTAAVQANDHAEGSKHGPRLHLSADQCGLATPFNVLVDGGGVWLYRNSGYPREIHFHGGNIYVDEVPQQLSARDMKLLREMEDKTRSLLPQVAEIARDVVDINYDALAGVVEVMTGSAINARKIEQMRMRAIDYVNESLGKGRWDQEAFDGNFANYLAADAETFKGSIARHLLWLIVTGRSKKIEHRAEKMGDGFDIGLNVRRDSINSRANTLCARVEELRVLQDSLEFRYNGRPLLMLAPAWPVPSARPGKPHDELVNVHTTLSPDQSRKAGRLPSRRIH